MCVRVNGLLESLRDSVLNSNVIRPFFAVGATWRIRLNDLTTSGSVEGWVYQMGVVTVEGEGQFWG